MNPLAQNLNNELYQYNPEVLSMLSQLGKEMFFTQKVFFSQSADAKSTKYNATIGMATDKDGKMYANELYGVFNHLSPDEIFPLCATSRH